MLQRGCRRVLSRDHNRKLTFSRETKPSRAESSSFVVILIIDVNSFGMFCEKSIELIRELHRMSDGQLPAFNVSVALFHSDHYFNS